MEKYQSGEKEKISFLHKMGLRKKSNLDSHLENGKNTVKKKRVNNGKKIDDIFNRIMEELPQYVIGQVNYRVMLFRQMDQRYLCLSMKRASCNIVESQELMRFVF